MLATSDAAFAPAEGQRDGVGDGVFGEWSGDRPPAFAADDVVSAIHNFREPAFVVVDPATGRRGIAIGGTMIEAGRPGSWPVMAALPAMYPEWLGDRSFNEVHGTRFPYVTGAMANGIATTRLVIADGPRRLPRLLRRRRTQP